MVKMNREGYIINRNKMMIEVLKLLRDREDLYYVEAAPRLNVSLSTVRGLMRMLSVMFNIPYKNGFLDNPGAEKVDEYIGALQRQIEEAAQRIIERRRRRERARRKKKRRRKR